MQLGIREPFLPESKGCVNMSQHIPVVSTVFVVSEGAVVTGNTVVTTGVVETGVKVVTFMIGVVVMPGFVVASDTVAIVALVVTVGSGINTINITQVAMSQAEVKYIP